MRLLNTFGVSVLLLSCSLASAQEWGSIKGQLVMENGKAPAPKKLEITKDQDHCLSKGDLVAEQYVVNPKNGGVRYVVVWIATDKDGRSDHKAELPLHPSVAKIAADKK